MLDFEKIEDFLQDCGKEVDYIHGELAEEEWSTEYQVLRMLDKMWQYAEGPYDKMNLLDLENMVNMGRGSWRDFLQEIQWYRDNFEEGY